MLRVSVISAACLAIGTSVSALGDADSSSRSFIHVQNIDGVYWLIDPSGKPRKR